MKPQVFCYLLAGDSFLAEEKLKDLTRAIQKKTEGELTQFAHYLSDTSLESVLASARTLPFLAQAQLFVLKDADTLKKKDLEMLSRYLEVPSERTFLIFIADDLEKDSPLAVLIGQHGEVHWVTSKEKKTAGEKYIREKLKAAGKTMTPQAIERLSDWTGDAPAFLDSILNQVILYSEKNAVIDEEALQKFEENRKQVDVFKLTDAVIQRDAEKALKTYHAWLREGEGDVTELVGLMHWQLRRFWKAKSLLEQGAATSQIASECRLSPKQAPFFMNQLKQVSSARLHKAIEGLFQLDRKMKSGDAEAKSGFEKWLVETTS